jgi:hypothetical protein
MDLLPPSPPTRGGGLRLKNQTTERAGCYLPAQGPVWPFSFTARIRRRFPGTLPHGQQPLTEKRCSPGRNGAGIRPPRPAEASDHAENLAYCPRRGRQHRARSRGVTALTATARADTQLTCQGNYAAPDAICTIKVTLTAPTYITVKGSWAPQASWITGGVSWSGSCTLDGQTAAIPQAGLHDTSPVTAGIQLPFTDPASCTVTVTAAASGNPSYSEPNVVYLFLLTNGTPPAPAPSPSPSAPAAHLVRGMSGTCLRDTGNSAAKRTKITIWKCDPAGPAQQWTYKGDELKIHGNMCVNAKRPR